MGGWGSWESSDEEVSYNWLSDQMEVGLQCLSVENVLLSTKNSPQPPPTALSFHKVMTGNGKGGGGSSEYFEPAERDEPSFSISEVTPIQYQEGTRIPDPRQVDSEESSQSQVQEHQEDPSRGSWRGQASLD